MYARALVMDGSNNIGSIATLTAAITMQVGSGDTLYIGNTFLTEVNITTLAGSGGQAVVSTALVVDANTTSTRSAQPRHQQHVGILVETPVKRFSVWSNISQPTPSD
ncbi:hypothetical protein PHYPSEUDO_000467 [Phytophthora pseudosyringae]|uniref:Uncharacterized protein n=1 Tax=Phytophthora pseudosyringae TaxID=221518 RepID=A0A8T1W2B6_9STRA|nr:hypothetical protein PHYPSEUDO_000467 [Phytophthora pseudosyringae]